MSEERHINFKLMRQYILDHQDAEQPGPHAKKYWRSLEELADAPVFREFVEREYPQHAEVWDDPFERRTFLKLMGASLALAGLSGCAFQPPEKIVPYVTQPEDGIPGKALFFATALTLGGVATPLLARSNEGRPTKLEGNPDHPQNRSVDSKEIGSSATDIFSQASILDLYDPDRSQTALYRDEPRPWSTFVGEIRTALDEQRPKQGSGLRFLTETITSPTLIAQMKGILTEFPQARWHQYEPVNNDNALAGALSAFGQAANIVYDFTKADRVLSLDADFLSAVPGTLKYARDFMSRRKVSKETGGPEMNRLYVLETTPTTTGARADHCWTIKPSELVNAARAISVGIGVKNVSGTSSTSGLDAIARDLQQHRGKSIVLAGREAPVEVHALAHALNDALGNVGQTVRYVESLEPNPIPQTESLRQLLTDIDAGKVELLVMVGGNPVYNTPADLKLDRDRMFKVKLRMHLSAYRDETSELCHWHIPEAHYLEAWSDTRTHDGTVTIVQPLIEPLFQSHSAHELLAVFSPQYDRPAYEIIREYWQGARAQLGRTAQPAAQASPQPAQGSAGTQPRPAASPAASPTPSSAADFESWWRKCVHDGFIPGSEFAAKNVSVNLQSPPAAAAESPGANSFEIVFRCDPSIYDGRFANNGWLQELPKPLSKVTWDNVALISPKTAERLGVTRSIGQKGGDIHVDKVTINFKGRAISAPVPTWITPGQPDDVITVHLGYGRRLAGKVGNNHGFNAYEIRTTDSPWSGLNAQVEKAAGTYPIAATQLHFNLEDLNFSHEPRDIVREQTIEEFRHGKHETHSHEPGPNETLYPNYDYQNQGLGYAWGMAIDLNNCIGCNACTIACQSENNIPIVGKEQVIRSREMHWIRLDTYFRGDDVNHPEGTNFMPVPCMHCENAPCEPVCPVHATVHSAEGLNDMVYNRCVGTKYCSNNCPYKVRRFNFFLYQDWDAPTYQLMRNPEVSIRSRGVMEKCTYCVQRIQAAKISSEIDGRKIADGEVVTACQAVCPTEAIVFGDINDPNSKVSKLKAEERNYSLLGELNTRPRTTYLSSLKNPNPEIAPDQH